MEKIWKVTGSQMGNLVVIKDDTICAGHSKHFNFNQSLATVSDFSFLSNLNGVSFRYIKLLLLIFTLAHMSAFGSGGLNQDSVSQSVQEYADTNGFSFNLPERYKFVKVITNDHMNYEWAIKSQDYEMEVRYAIRSHDLFMPKQMIMVTMLNISGSEPNFKPFPPAAVKSEFNADAGSSGYTEVLADFGGKYKKCFVMNIAKKSVGDAYLFLMVNDKKIISNLMMDVFHSLKFKANQQDSLLNRVVFEKTMIQWINKIGFEIDNLSNGVDSISDKITNLPDSNQVSMGNQLSDLKQKTTLLKSYFSDLEKNMLLESETPFTDLLRRIRAEFWVVKNEIRKVRDSLK
ncbi:MAG: hypothetical protein ACJA0Q_001750 [Saprospiraceae bacterium]|jgi:hypothetical protein